MPRGKQVFPKKGSAKVGKDFFGGGTPKKKVKKPTKSTKRGARSTEHAKTKTPVMGKDRTSKHIKKLKSNKRGRK